MRKRRQQAHAAPGSGAPESRLPLRPRAFAVLAVLAEGPLPGIDILQRVEDIGASILGPGTLYRLLRELRDEGLVERTAQPPAGTVDDERRAYHALTPRGRELLVAEAARLRRTIEAAGLGLPRPSGS